MATVLTDRPLLGAIEAGGTKFVLATGTADGTIVSRQTIPTADPVSTMAAARDWLDAQPAIAALGIASFGPVELDRRAPLWGHITETPKPGWSNCDLAGYFVGELGVPVGFDTDVNGAALGEFHLGAGRDTSGMAYVTVGTGIGGGLIINGQVVHGAGHPEMGHIYPRRAADDDEFAGACPFHGDCLEGLASGPAILSRWGETLSDLPAEHGAHDRVAGYLAQLCHTLLAINAIETIVIGGGVMQAPGLLARVGTKTRAIGADYLPGRKQQRVVAPELGQDAGIIGALLLAEAARME